MFYLRSGFLKSLFLWQQSFHLQVIMLQSQVVFQTPVGVDIQHATCFISNMHQLYDHVAEFLIFFLNQSF